MKSFKAVVVHTKMNKTAKVVYSRVVVHPVYKKRRKVLRNYLVHDDVGVKRGDRVLVVETRPMSKLKKYRIDKIL